MRPTPKALLSLLSALANQGVSQGDIAAKVGIPPQVLSDVKTGRRPLTERLARLLAEGYGADYWSLMGEKGGSKLGVMPGVAGAAGIWLPVLPHPVEGDPTAHRQWAGDYCHVPAIARPALATALNPYVLRFRKKDVEHRLHTNDLILISQTANETAAIVVIRTGRGCYLARRRGNRWIRLATGEDTNADVVVVGHCLGVLWSEL